MTLSNPLAGDLHVNAPLTNFGQKYLQDASAFVAGVAMPNLPVSKQSDLYWIFDRADWYRDEAKERADGTESEGSGFSLSTSPYYAKVYAHHKDVTDRQRANADAAVNPDNSAVEFVTRKLLIRREALFISKFFVTSVWANQDVGVTSGPVAGTSFLRWDVSTSDPVNDVRMAIELVQGKTGYRMNKMLIQRQVWNRLLENDSILSRIVGGATANTPAIVMKQLIAQLFEIDAIYILEAVWNTANKGATEATSFMAGKHALLYYAPNSVSVEEPTAGVTFSWTGFMGATSNGMRIKRFRMEELESDRVEGQMAFVQQIIGSDLGFFFLDAIS